ncbi:MAG TPA: hypothetical protein VE871_11130 [Longimicrobium sp.]|nr:hypothetical protein [Longimicrobium sp.]
MASFHSIHSILLAVFFTACTGSGAAAVQRGAWVPDAEARRRAASAVTEVAASGADASFTMVARLDVDSRGYIYVPDTYQHRVTVLGPEARLQRSFGRRGSGPNEFRSVGAVQVLPGDSVLVYDPELGRVSVFAPDSGLAAYHVNLGDKLNVSMPRELRRTRANDAMLSHHRPGFSFGPGQDFSNRKDKLRVLAPDGSLRTELLTFPSQSFLVAQTSVTPHPFGQQGFARLDSRGRVHFAWSDTLGVRTYALDGTPSGGFRIDYQPPRLTREDVESAAEEFDGMRRLFEPVLSDSAASRWPAVRAFLVDDRDRLWFELGGSRAQETEWAAFSADGAYLGSVLIPAGSDVRLIRGDGSIYAARKDESDVPHVVVYRMVRPLG